MDPKTPEGGGTGTLLALTPGWWWKNGTPLALTPGCGWKSGTFWL